MKSEIIFIFSRFFVFLVFFFLKSLNGGIMLKEDIFQPTEQKSKIIETLYYKATIVPEAGGRILSFVDKKTNTEILFSDIFNKISSWGGLLDDKRGRENKPYTFKIETQKEGELKISLSFKDEQKKQSVIKELTFYENIPLIKVEYTYINESQEKMTNNDTAVRNGILPGGSSVSENDIYSIPTIKAVRSFSPVGKFPPEFNQKIKRMIGAPWHAFLNKEKLSGLTFVHLDDGYTGWYMWKQGIPHPTYEWYQKSVPPGKKVTYKTLIVLTHGFDKLTDASPDYLLSIKDLFVDGELSLEIKLSGVTKILNDVEIRLHLKDFNGNTLRQIDSARFNKVDIDNPVTKSVSAGKIDKGFYILKGEIVSKNEKIGDFEDILSIDSGYFTNTNYTREIQYLSKSEYEDIPSWEPVKKEVVKPDLEDQKRGYLVYSKIEKIEKGYKLDLTSGEFETFCLVWYPLKKDIGMVSWGASNLKSIKTDKPIKNYPETFIEETEEFDASLWGYEDPIPLYKLVPNYRFNGNKEKSLWVKVSTHNLVTGEYVFNIYIVPDSGKEITIPVFLNVRKIEMPDKLVSLEVEGYFESFGNPKENLRGVENYFKDLKEHNVNFLQGFEGWGITPDRRKEIKIMGSGESLPDFIKRNKDIDENVLQKTFLDFTYYNDWIEKAIENGLIRFKTSYYSQELPKKLNLWALKELNWYLKEKGFPDDSLFIKILDEQPKDVYPKMAEVGKKLREIGWLPFTTVNLLVAQPEELKILSQSFCMYQGGYSEPEEVSKRIKEGILKPTDEIWEYTGVGTSNCSYQSFISKGWYIGFNKLDGFHNHEYSRGGGRRLGALIIFPTPIGPITSPAWEGLRDGIDNANLYRFCENLIFHIEEQKLAEPIRIKEWIKKFYQICGYGNDSIISFKKEEILKGIFKTKIIEEDFSLEKSYKAKKALLDLIEEILEETAPKLKYDVKWGKRNLIEEGDLKYTLASGKGIKKENLTPLLKKFSQGTDKKIDTIPFGKNTLNIGNLILVGTLQDPIIQDIIKRNEELKHRYNESYPQKKDYVIITTDNPLVKGTKIIIILGGDVDGVSLGVKQFSCFLKKVLHIKDIKRERIKWEN